MRQPDLQQDFLKAHVALDKDSHRQFRCDAANADKTP